MKDTINQSSQSIAIISKWFADLKHSVHDPANFLDIEGYEKLPMKIYETCDKKETQELAKQCRIVGLNRLASELEMSMGIAILEDSQEQMNNQ